MATKTIIWAMRHGPTSWNLEKRIQGNIDTDIMPDKIDSYLETLGVKSIPQPDVIVVSKLKRTEQTARALISLMNWPDIHIHKDVRLHERKWGIFEGIPDSEAKKKILEEPSLRLSFPDIKNNDDAIKLWDTKGFKVLDGEASDEVYARVQPALTEIIASYPGKKILFISHAGVLIALGLNPHVISTYEPKY